MIQIRANMNNDTIQKGALVDILFAQQKTDCLEGRGKNKYINFFFLFSFFLPLESSFRKNGDCCQTHGKGDVLEL